MNETPRFSTGMIMRDVTALGMVVVGAATLTWSVGMIAGLWGWIACVGAVVLWAGYSLTRYTPPQPRVRRPSEVVGSTTMEVRPRRPEDGPA